MANVVYDRVKETTASTGAGDLVLAGAAQGYRTFSSVCVDGDIVPYYCEGGTEFETGVGRYNSGANSITRLEIKASSNAGAAVVFSAGTKNIAISALAAQVGPIGTFPFTSATGLMFRYNALLSKTDQTSLGYAKKIYDISGNARHSDTNTTNPPKWSQRGFNGTLPGLWFNFNMKHTISAMPGLGSPLACTIVIVAQDFIASGNSHIYNWAGNPIGFGSGTPLDFMYNGTLPAAHPMSAESKNLPTQELLGYPVVALHVYNGAASVYSINNNEITISPGTSATGATNFFTIGSDSSSGIGGGTAQTSKMLLHEIAVLNFAASTAQRASLLAYYKTAAGIVTP